MIRYLDISSQYYCDYLLMVPMSICYKIILVNYNCKFKILKLLKGAKLIISMIDQNKSFHGSLEIFFVYFVNFVVNRLVKERKKMK